jgi:hypothetical protein
MKPLSVLGLLYCVVAGATNPQLGKVQSVYVLPMSGGMDQYLANRLTSMGVFQVVTDPQKADTVLTDGLGKGFEDKMKELYPPPPAVKKVEEKEKAADKETEKAKDDDKNKDKTADADKDSDKDKEKDSKTSVSSSPSSRQIRLQDLPPVQSSWGHGRGNFFLVDRQSRSVIWSIYERPKNTTPDELTKTATKVVQRLKKDLEPPKEARNQ